MKIFRRFRESVIQGNGLRKYLLYAIGEIILVVIGILIALGINNRSEQRKKEQETHRTAELVWIQLAQDATDIRQILKQYRYYDKVADTILVHTKKGEPLPENCKNCFNLLFGIQLPVISERISNLVERNTLVEGEIEAKLLQIDLRYKEMIINSREQNTLIINTLQDNLSYLKEEYGWFSEFIQTQQCASESCIDYFLNSEDYRNRVAYYRFLGIESYLGNLSKFLCEIEKDYEELSNIL